MITPVINRPKGFGFNEKVTSIVGIDPSLAGLGFAHIRNGKLVYYSGWTEIKRDQKANKKILNWYKLATNNEIEQQRRLHIITNWVGGLLNHIALTSDRMFVAIESSSFSKNSRALSGLHELNGVIKNMLWDCRYLFRTYDPMSIKLAWAGNGHAEKKEMVATANDNFNLNLDDSDGFSDNLADAVLIAGLCKIEIDLKDGTLNLKDLDEDVRRVLLRTTGGNPEALISRTFVGYDHCDSGRMPIYATGSFRKEE